MSAFAERRARMRALRPYPLAPLAQACGIAPADTAALSLRLDIGRRWVRRYRAWGLTERQADNWATRAGVHPVNVWPDFYRRAELRGVAARNAGKGTCAEGHRYDGVNSRGERTCSVCQAEAARRYRANLQARRDLRQRTATVVDIQTRQEICETAGHRNHDTLPEAM